MKYQSECDMSRNVTLTDLHGDDAAWYQLAVLSCREVPRSYSHQIVECELENESTFTKNLKQQNSSRTIVLSKMIRLQLIP